MATEVLTLKMRVNWRRYHAIEQEAKARIRRAPRNERPAMLDRYAARLVRECVRVRAQ